MSKKIKLIIFAAAGAALSLPFTLAMKPVFESSAMLEVKIRHPENLAALGYDRLSDKLLATESEKLVSRPVVRQALLKQNMIWEGMNPADEEKVLRAVSSGIRAGRIKNANIIRITVVHKDPGIASGVTEKLIDAYIHRGALQAEKAREKELEPLRMRAEKIEAAIKEKSSRLDRMSSPGSGTVSTQNLEEKLLDIDSKLKELSSRYGDLHPQLVSLREQKTGISRQISELNGRNRLIEEINRGRAELEEVNKKMGSLGYGDSVAIDSINVITQAGAARRVITVNFARNVSAGALIGLIAGFIAVRRSGGVEISMNDIDKIEDYLKVPVIGIIPEIKRYGKKPQPALKKLRPSGSRSAGNLFDRLLNFTCTINTPVCEAYYSMWINIKHSMKNRGKKVHLFTSPDFREGKTITAVNYALSNAMSGGRTLYIEADFINPAASGLFGFDEGPGLSDIVLKGAGWRQCARRLSGSWKGGGAGIGGFENMYVITCGSVRSGTVNAVDSPGFDSFLREAKQEYDVIVIDSSPLLQTAEPIILASKADDVILVYKPGISTRGVLKRVMTQLEQASADVLGIVLNDIRVSEVYSRFVFTKTSVPEKEKAIKKVLVIDNHKDLSNTVTRLFLKKSKYKYMIRSVTGRDDITSVISSFSPDLIVIDVNYSGRDTYHICKYVRSHPELKKIKIVALWGTRDIKTRLLTCGVDECLAKPLDDEEFFKCINGPEKSKQA
ncbi:MAG: response regulator [Elusimicrobia bacterium]|nr:response regulator [Elusimicrobiota bacterium]